MRCILPEWFTLLQFLIESSFQDGVNKIYNKLKGLGFTPAANSPDGICQAIQTIHDTRYTNGYNAGRLQGQEDVKRNSQPQAAVLVN